MDPFEAYSFLFADSLISALLIPVRTELAFPAMIIFDSYNDYLVLAFALIAVMLATFINYYLGKLIVIAAKKDIRDSIPESSIWHKICIDKAHFFALLLWLPVFGAIITLAAGYLKVDFKKYIFFGCAGIAAKYILYIYNINVY